MEDAEAEAKLKEKGLTSDRIDEFKVAFDMLSVRVADNTYKITTDSIGTLLNVSFGQSYSADDLSYMLKQFSETGDVDFYHFALSLDAKMRDPRYNEAYADAFDLFDTQKKGELTKETLQAGMKALGEVLTDEEAEEMLKIAKTKPDFVKTMSSGGAVGGGGGGSSGAAASAATAATPAAAPAPAAAEAPKAPTLSAAPRGGSARGGSARGARGGGSARGARGGSARGARGGSARGARGGSARGARGASRGARGARGGSTRGRGRGS